MPSFQKSLIVEQFQGNYLKCCWKAYFFSFKMMYFFPSNLKYFLRKKHFLAMAGFARPGILGKRVNPVAFVAIPLHSFTRLLSLPRLYVSFDTASSLTTFL